MMYYIAIIAIIAKLSGLNLEWVYILIPVYLIIIQLLWTKFVKEPEEMARYYKEIENQLSGKSTEEKIKFLEMLSSATQKTIDMQIKEPINTWSLIIADQMKPKLKVLQILLKKYKNE